MPDPKMPTEATWCDNFPDWQGCECECERGHEGPHVCVCGAEWNDDGELLLAGRNARGGA
jgi:hypothetical protein